MEHLDLNKIEDLFFCIDVLTRVRLKVKESEPFLAEDVERIIQSMVAMSDPDEKKVPQALCRPAEKTIDHAEQEGVRVGSEDQIVDLFTGDVIDVSQ